MKAGWEGLFAVEKEKNAFATLSHNLIEQREGAPRFQWPEWLPKQPKSVETLLRDYRPELNDLSGKVTLLAGGPPCQGFSTLGRRLQTDPRNQAFRSYLRMVRILKPAVVLMENVRGIASAFDLPTKPNHDAKQLKYSELISSSLRRLGYTVWTRTILARDFGVPQTRPRFIVIGYYRGEWIKEITPFFVLDQLREEFLRRRNLRAPVGTKQALNDLRTAGMELAPCVDSPTHRQGPHRSPRSSYQKLLHNGLNGVAPNSHRLANHRSDTVSKFKWLISNCEKGRVLSPDERGIHITGKRTVYVLDPMAPAPTVTTLPDDMLHYAEPRILSVREMARLQSFPDWFEFKGKYTTGGELRVKECPRYTQVGNAVPPLLAEAMGEALREFYSAAHGSE